MVEASCDLNKILENTHLLKDLKATDSEIVITRYNEPLEWTKTIAHLCTVYNKGTTPVPAYPYNKVIKTPNTGYDIETILRHIILNYETLSIITFFCQGTIGDRSDQPLYPLEWYLLDPKANDFRAVEDSLDDSPNFRIPAKVHSELCRTVSERTFAKFRKEIVGISYRQGIDKWVKGDWMAVGRAKIRSKPLEYYVGLYLRCQFTRGNEVEEIWFLERCYYSIFHRPLDPFFKYIPKRERQEELLKYLRKIEVE